MIRYDLIYFFTYICTYICIYIDLYIYIYVYMYMYIYIYTNNMAPLMYVNTYSMGSNIVLLLIDRKETKHCLTNLLTPCDTT